MATSGTIYTGVNVEISSYGHFLCAERAAITAAITAGEEAIIELATACIDTNELSSINQKVPCRTCRQWLVELAPNCIVYVHGMQEIFLVSSQEWRDSCSRGDFRRVEAKEQHA